MNKLLRLTLSLVLLVSAPALAQLAPPATDLNITVSKVVVNRSLLESFGFTYNWVQQSSGHASLVSLTRNSDVTVSRSGLESPVFAFLSQLATQGPLGVDNFSLALASQNLATIETMPRLYTTFDHPAVLAAGERSVYPATAKALVQLAQFNLTIMPSRADDKLHLVLALTNEAGVLNQRNGTISGPLQTIHTEIITYPNEPAILSSLGQVTTYRTGSYLRGFSKLPVLGRLFQKSGPLQTNTSDLLFLVTPRLTPVVATTN